MHAASSALRPGADGLHADAAYGDAVIVLYGARIVNGRDTEEHGVVVMVGGKSVGNASIIAVSDFPETPKTPRIPDQPSRWCGRRRDNRH